MNQTEEQAMKKTIIVLMTFVVSTHLFAQRTITVTGAGSNEVNKTYTEMGVADGKPLFLTSLPPLMEIRWLSGGNQWVIQSPDLGTIYYINTQDTDLPPRNNWILLMGLPPEPTLSGDGTLPVELAQFSVHVQNHHVMVVWRTESEVDNLGFILERSVDNTRWVRIASYQTHDELKGQGNTSVGTKYVFTDQSVEPGRKYWYRLSDVSTKGEITTHPAISI